MNALVCPFLEPSGASQDGDQPAHLYHVKEMEMLSRRRRKTQELTLATQRMVL